MLSLNSFRSTRAQPLPTSSLTWARPRSTDFAFAPSGSARTPPKSSGPTAPLSSCFHLASTAPGSPVPQDPNQPSPRSQNAAWRMNSFPSSSSPSWPWRPSSSRSPSNTLWSNEHRPCITLSKWVSLLMFVFLSLFFVPAPLSRSRVKGRIEKRKL